MNVEIEDLTRRFGGARAVAGVSLEVAPGVLGLLGPNGAGKTSLLRVLATVLAPSSGSLRLLGRDPRAYGSRREIRRRLGYLPQSLGDYPGFTVVEFVEYFALLKEMPTTRVPAAVAAAVEQVGLGEHARAKLRTLSGGMLRRVGIAQAIVNEPELLLLDEPTAGLDPEQRVAFRALLRDIGQRATVIVSTHLVEDVGAACSEVALMNQGRIVFHGTPDELTVQGEQGHGVGDAPLERGYSAVLRRPGHDRHRNPDGAADDGPRVRWRVGPTGALGADQRDLAVAATSSVVPRRPSRDPIHAAAPYLS
jgi:ABC-type multidrug transport system ATPase subunit